LTLICVLGYFDIFLRIAYELLYFITDVSVALFDPYWNQNKFLYGRIQSLWHLFVWIVRTCAAPKITLSTIDQLSEGIVRFEQEYAALLGNEHITYLTHQMRHIPNMIKELGMRIAVAATAACMATWCLFRSTAPAHAHRACLYIYI